MLSCKEITHLLSEEQDRKLTFNQRFKLMTHLAMCVGCSRYKKQINFIRQACRGFVEGSGDTSK